MKNDVLAPSLNPANLVALLVVLFLGFDFLDFPYDAAKTCGPSGYWALLVSVCLVALPLLFLVVLMQRRFPGQNLMETANQVLGKLPAAVGNMIFISTYAVWLVLSIRDSSELVLIYFLNRTPLWAITLLFLLGTGYIAFNGLAPAVRLAAFVFIPTVLFRFMMQFFALQGLKPSFLLPLFSATPLDYLRGGLELANVFIPLTTLFLIQPSIKNTGKSTVAIFSAITIASLSFFLGLIGAIGVFGDELTQVFTWSEFASVQRINIPFLVLEQVGLLFLIIWVTMFFVGVCFYLAIIARSLQQQFPVVRYRMMIVVLLVLIGSIGMMFPNATVSHALFRSWRRWLTLPVAVYPLLVYLIAILKGKRGVPHGQ